MPGPGFFSTPPAATVVATINAAAAAATTQSAIVTALGGKPGVILQAPAPQSIPVIGVGELGFEKWCWSRSLEIGSTSYL